MACPTVVGQPVPQVPAIQGEQPQPIGEALLGLAPLEWGAGGPVVAMAPLETVERARIVLGHLAHHGLADLPSAGAIVEAGKKLGLRGRVGVGEI